MKKLLILVGVFVIVGIVPIFLKPVPMVDVAIAEGIGRTLLVGLLSCVGLLYKRNKTLGFGIAAAIFSALVLYAGITQGTL